MPIRTDLNAAIRPTQTGTQPAVTVPAGPPPTMEQLISKALDGTISPAEAAALSGLLNSPEGKDKFSPEQRKDLQKLSNGNAPPPREAGELHSDLSKLSEAGELPGRFSADFLLMKQALLDHPGLLRADKATRMFEFAVPYAQALTEMAQNPAQKNALAAQLVVAAEKLGYKDIQRQPDGANGLSALKELTQAKTPDDVARLAQGLRFDAPIWPKDPAQRSTEQRARDHENLQAVQGAKPGEAMRPLPPVMMPPVPIQRRVDEEPEAHRSSDDDRSNKKLGPMMLWNALHRLRDTGEDGKESAAQREALTQLAVAGGLILVLMAVLVAVMVAL